MDEEFGYMCDTHKVRYPGGGACCKCEGIRRQVLGAQQNYCHLHELLYIEDACPRCVAVTAPRPKEGADGGMKGSDTSGADPMQTQIGGDHYKKMKIQPMEFSMANGLDACQHTIIKYVTRFRDKGGIADLEKARHVIDMLIQFEKDK